MQTAAQPESVLYTTVQVWIGLPADRYCLLYKPRLLANWCITGSALLVFIGHWSMLAD